MLRRCVLPCQACDGGRIEFFDHCGNQLNCPIIVVLMNDTSMAVYVTGWNGNHQIWDSPAVKMNCSRISPSSLEKVKLERDLQLLRSLDEKITESKVWNHAAVTDHNHR